VARDHDLHDHCDRCGVCAGGVGRHHSGLCIDCRRQS
jgi:hypothetical protein